MPPELHYDLSRIDFTKLVADKELIRKYNPQRFEMEQLDGVVYLDKEKHIVVGYKDVRHDEFWVRGHMPGFPLLPGVLMCEASAQLCSFYITYSEFPGQSDFIGFGGMEDVRFRATVHPGSRLILVGKGIKMHRRKMEFDVQGIVGDTMVFHGVIIGVPMAARKEEK